MIYIFFSSRKRTTYCKRYVKELPRRCLFQKRIYAYTLFDLFNNLIFDITHFFAKIWGNWTLFVRLGRAYTRLRARRTYTLTRIRRHSACGNRVRLKVFFGVFHVCPLENCGKLRGIHFAILQAIKPQVCALLFLVSFSCATRKSTYCTSKKKDIRLHIRKTYMQTKQKTIQKRDSLFLFSKHGYPVGLLLMRA